MKRKTKKNLKNSLIIFSVILLLGVIAYFGVLQAVDQNLYNNQCSLPSCPSGYTKYGNIVCDNFKCIQGCRKEVSGKCGTYTKVADVKKTYSLSKIHNDKWVDMNSVIDPSTFPKYTEKSGDNGCFKYTSTAIFRVTNNKPGGWLTKASDSHKILTSQSLTTKSWDECSPSNTIVVSSGDWVVRGSSRTVRPEAKYISYRDDSCWGDKSYGSEGQMTIGLIVERANYVIGYDYKSTVCDYECEKTSDCGSKESVGERYCSGKNIVQDYSVPKCVKYDCELNDLTETIKTCSNSCEDGVCVTFDDDEEEEEICLTVCVEMYEIIDNKCVFDNCGSGCGVNEVTTFDTKKECENNLEKPPIECAISEDCKEIAKVVCDDKSLWYHDYSCVNGVCAISLDIPPESCIRGGEDEEKTSWLIYLIPIVSGFVLILFIFIISNFIKRRKR